MVSWFTGIANFVYNYVNYKNRYNVRDQGIFYTQSGARTWQAFLGFSIASFLYSKP